MPCPSQRGDCQMQAEQCNAAQSQAKRSKTLAAASDMIQPHNSHCCATCKLVKPVNASAAHSLQLAEVRSRCEVVSFRWSLCCRAVQVLCALLPFVDLLAPAACMSGGVLAGWPLETHPSQACIQHRCRRCGPQSSILAFLVLRCL